MSDDFIDSNVLVYVFSLSEPGKQEVASRLIAAALEGGGVISHQVVQETLNVITRKMKATVSVEDARAFFEDVLVPLWKVMPSAALYQRGLDIQSRYGYSFYDALIIAAALQAGCKRIYSEDLQNGQRIEGLQIEDPFRG